MPGAFSSQGAVLDAIISMIGNLPAVTSSNPPITVFDGIPGGANKPNTFIAITGAEEPLVIRGTEEWSWIGVQGRYEEYSITGHVFSYVGGDDNLGQLSPSDAQKTARDQATALMQAIEAGLLADVSLMNENNGQQLVIWAYVNRTNLQQTSINDPDAGKGRWAQYDFNIAVKNTLETGVVG